MMIDKNNVFCFFLDSNGIRTWSDLYPGIPGRREARATKGYSRLQQIGENRFVKYKIKSSTDVAKCYGKSFVQNPLLQNGSSSSRWFSKQEIELTLNPTARDGRQNTKRHAQHPDHLFVLGKTTPSTLGFVLFQIGKSTNFIPVER